MIEVVKGDILESGCEFLCNPVNCVGVMGAGLALRYKQLFPDVYRRYKNDCSSRLLRCGNVYVYPVDPQLEKLPSTVNAPSAILCTTTKYHWREPSSPAIVEGVLDGLLRLEAHGTFEKRTGKPEHLDGGRVAIVKFGAGLGGVDEKIVLNLVFSKLKNSKTKFVLYDL